MNFSIDKNKFNLMSKEGIDSFIQVKLFWFLSLLMFTVSAINIFVIFKTFNGDKSIAGILLMNTLSLYFVFSIPRSLKVNIPKFVLGVLVTFMPFVRIYYSGGVSSPVLPVMFPVIIFIFIGYGLKRGLMYGAYVVALYAYFFFYPPPQFYGPNPYLAFGMFLISILFILGCFKIIVEKEKLLSSHLVAMEKENAENEIIAQLCHEINNPLNIILGMTKMSQDQKKGTGVETRDSNLTTIHEQSRRIDELVKKIKARLDRS